MTRAAAAGASAGIIGCLEEPTVELSNALMRHDRHQRDPRDRRPLHGQGGLFLGQAGDRCRRAGNTPAVIDEKADIKRAVARS